MSAGTLVSRGLGFVRDMLIAALFSRSETDVFFVAFRFPNFFRRFLGEGSFSASLTPAIAETLEEKGGRERARAFYSALFALLFCATSFLTVLGMVFMDRIMEALFGGSPYALVPGKLEKTIIAGRIVFIYLFLASAYSYFMAAAQALKSFFLPALAPALFNGCLIALALLPQSWWPFPALSLAWAVALGGLAQLGLVLFVICKLKFWPRLGFWRDSQSWGAAKKVLRRFFPAAAGLSGLALIGLINVYFAGWLEEGAHTAIYYGDRLMELPRSLIALSIGMALIPELARLRAAGDSAGFFQTAGHCMDLSLFLTLPCALVFLLAPAPIIEALFQRGAFDGAAAAKTAMILRVYSLALVFSSAARIFSSCFFAAGKNWTAALGSGLYVAIHGALAWILTPAFGLAGLVWATALSSGFHALLLWGLMSRCVGQLPLRQTGARLLRTAPGLGLLALALLLHKPLLDFLSALGAALGAALGYEGSLVFYEAGRALSLGLILLAGGGLYVLSGIFFKHPMAGELRDLLKLKAPV